MLRLKRFLIALTVGLALGLLYGWVISPVVIVDTSPEMMREDYRTDMVLMTAEIFSESGDLNIPLLTLKLVSSQTPSATVGQAIGYARTAGYAENDITLLQILAAALSSSPGVSP